MRNKGYRNMYKRSSLLNHESTCSLERDATPNKKQLFGKKNSCALCGGLKVSNTSLCIICSKKKGSCTGEFLRSSVERKGLTGSVERLLHTRDNFGRDRDRTEHYPRDSGLRVSGLQRSKERSNYSPDRSQRYDDTRREGNQFARRGNLRTTREWRN
jgi:hypothetical protein